MTKSWQFSKMTCMWILAGPTRLSLEACLPHSFSIIGARLFSMSLTSNAKSMSFTNTCHIGRLYFTTYPECFGPAAAASSSSAWLGPAFLSPRGVRLTLINQLRWHTSDPAKFLYSAELSFRPPLSYIFLQKLISIVVRRAAAAVTIVTQVARLCGGGGALVDGAPPSSWLVQFNGYLAFVCQDM